MVLEASEGAPAGLRRAIREHGTAGEALERGVVTPPRALRPLPEAVRALMPGDAEWPAGFGELEQAPALVFARGLPLASAPRLAVVGARDADEYGRRATTVLARAAAKAGWTVVSGGARGIDAAAHRAALDAGGRTVAVLGGGFGRPYPAEHGELFEAIAQQGTLLTEYPAWRRPRPGQFPERNRLVAAMSEAVLVVQARRRSGALATARVARTLGRPVLAVPGDICYRLSSGAVALLAAGALVVAGPEHLASLLGRLAAGRGVPDGKWPRDREPEAERDEEAAYGRWGLSAGADGAQDREGGSLAPWLRELLSDGRSQAVDDIVDRSGRATSEVLRAIVQGELEGAVERLPGGRVRLERLV